LRDWMRAHDDDPVTPMPLTNSSQRLEGGQQVAGRGNPPTCPDQPCGEPPPESDAYISFRAAPAPSNQRLASPWPDPCEGHELRKVAGGEHYARSGETPFSDMGVVVGAPLGIAIACKPSCGPAATAPERARNPKQQG